MIAVLLALGLTASVVPAGAAEAIAAELAQTDAAGQSDSAGEISAASEEPLVAQDEAAAQAFASQSGRRVEVLSARTETSATFANADGTWTLETAAGPVRVRDESAGSDHGWRDLDPTLEMAGGKVRPKAAAATVEFSTGGDGSAAVLRSNGRRLGFGWSGGSLPAPSLSGRTATYANVLPGADLVLEASTTGYSERLVLRRRPSRPMVLRFPLTLSDGLSVEATPEGRLIVREDGEVVMAADPALMWGAERGARSDEPVDLAEVDVQVVDTASGPVLEVRPDHGFLSDESVALPITVDPAFSLNVTKDTFVQSTILNTSQAASTELKAGYSTDGTPLKARSYLQFGVSDIVGADVTNADLKLYNFHSWSCSPRAVVVRNVQESWSEAMVWNGEPEYSQTKVWGQASFAHGYESGGCGNAWASIDITELGQAWATGTPNYGLRVSASETDEYAWKKFNSSESNNAPWISVTYNRPPATPTDLSPTGVFADLTPILRATFCDPDGGSGFVQYQVRKDGDLWPSTPSGRGPDVASCGSSNWTVASGLMSYGQKYFWRARRNDNRLTSAWTAGQAYTPNRDPNVPVLVSPANGHRDYAQPTQLKATYTDPDGDSGLLRFRLHESDGSQVPLDNDETPATDRSVSSGATATVTLPKLSVGSYSWTVVAVDDHDWASTLSNPRTFEYADPNIRIPEVTKTLTPLAGATLPLQTGDAFKYTIKITNNDAIARKALLTDSNLPAAMTTSLPLLAWSGSETCVEGDLPANGVLPTNVDCLLDLDDDGAKSLTIDTVLEPGVSRTATITGVVDAGVRGCETLSNTATVTNDHGPDTDTVNVSVCHRGLGLEKWWTTVDEDLGPQSTASVNVGTGNLVVQATDSTPVQARGRFAMVIRRTYNSADPTVATLPGTIGAGWQLNVGPTGDMLGDGVGASRLAVPSLDSITQPLAATLVDRDGTRHLFKPKSIGLTAATGALASVRSATPTTGTICVDQTYEAPPGVELAMWRYVDVGSKACADGIAGGTVYGWVAIRPDRLRYEFDTLGRVTHMVDGTGRGLRYTYSAGKLTRVHDWGCAGQVCDRDVDLTYSDANGNAIDERVTVTDPAGRETVYVLTDSQPQRLLRVTNPDDSAVDYTYHGINGACDGWTGQLCSASDLVPDAAGVPVVTQFTYTADPAGLAPPRPTWVRDRRSASTIISYDNASLTTVTQRDALTSGGDVRTTDHADREHAVHTFREIDAAGRVGRIDEAAEGGPVLRRTRYTWDAPTSDAALDALQEACRLGGAQQVDTDKDNLLCRVLREDLTNDGPSAAEDTRYTYNIDGQVLVTRRVNQDGAARSDAVSTFAYRTQFHRPTGPLVRRDTLAGSGYVVTGERDDEAAIYVVSDRVASLTPRGNAVPSAEVADYETTYAVDDTASVAPGTQAATSYCTGSPANTGLVCSVVAPQQRITSFTYDAYGQKTSALSPKARTQGGAATTYQYFANGDLVDGVPVGGWLEAVIDPAGDFVYFGYDAAGNVVKTWDRNATTGASPAAFDTPAERNDLYTETRYDTARANGALIPWRYLTSHRNQLGDTRTYEYNDDGDLLSETPPSGTAGKITHTYDRMGNRLTTTTPSTRLAGASSWKWIYDAAGRRISQTAPSASGVPPGVTTWSYDAAGRQTSTRWTRTSDPDVQPDASCPPVTAAVDALPAGAYVCGSTIDYDSVDNAVEVLDAEAKMTTISYDQLHQPVSRTVDRDSTVDPTTRWRYNRDGQVIDLCPPRETEPCDADTPVAERVFSTRHDYDEAGRLTRTRRFRDLPTTISITTEYDYDEDDNLIEVTDPNSKVTFYEYDLQNRRTLMKVPRTAGVVPETSWSYDASGNVTAVQRPDTAADPAINTDNSCRANADDVVVCRVTAYSYDAAHRLVDVVVAADHLEAAAAGLATPAGNQRSRRIYDVNGNVTKIFGPKAFTASTVDGEENHDFAVTIDYDDADRVSAQWTPRTSGAMTSAMTGHNDPQQNQCATEQARPATPNPYPDTTAVCGTGFGYDARDNVTSMVLPTDTGDGTVGLTWTYTDDNLVSSLTAPSPTGSTANPTVTTVYTHDAEGRLFKTIDPTNDMTKITYTGDGLVDQVNARHAGAGADELVYDYSYNANGDRTAVMDAASQESTTAYTSDGLVDEVKSPPLDPSGGVRNITRYRYDRNGNPVEVYSPAAVAVAPSNPTGAPTTYTYFDDNLVRTIGVPMDGDGTARRLTTFGYDPAGRKTTQSVQTQSRPADNDDPQQGWTLSDSAGMALFDYDRGDRLTTETGRSRTNAPQLPGPHVPTITTDYDAGGNPASITDSTNPDAVVAIKYYLDDLQRQVDDGDQVTRYTYNGAGQTVLRSTAVSEADPTAAELTRYTYNDAGMVISQTVRDHEAKTYDWTYRADGKTLTETQPNGHEATSVYYSDDTLDTYTLKNAADTTVAKWDYAYDALDRITSVNVPTAAKAASAPGAPATPGLHGYAYDGAGRITCHTVNTTDPGVCPEEGGPGATVGAWDPNGNRTRWGERTFTYNADDTIATTDKNGANTKNYDYETFGGIASDDCANFRYDEFDRLTEVAPAAGTLPPPPDCEGGSATVSYDYDGLDRQRATTITPGVAIPPIEPKITETHYDGTSSSLSDEIDTSGPVDVIKKLRHYTLDVTGAAKAVTTDAVPTQPDIEYLTTDGKGNIATVTADDDGNVTCAARYDPFGQPQNDDPSGGSQACTSGQTNSSIFYRGNRRDQTTGAYQLGSRTYDPTKAGFLTPDSYRAQQPIAELSVGVDPLTMNRYSYVNGDPVNMVDPDGHAPCSYDDTPDTSRCGGVRREPRTDEESWRAGEHAGPHDRQTSSANAGSTAGEHASRRNWTENRNSIIAATYFTTEAPARPAAPPRLGPDASLLDRYNYLVANVGWALSDMMWCADTLCGQSAGPYCPKCATGIAPIPGPGLWRAGSYTDEFAGVGSSMRSGAPQATRVADDVVGASQVTVLGRYRGGTEAFVGKPGFNVLDLPGKGTGRWYWSRNRAFIDDAIARGDEVRLVTDPHAPLYSGGNVYQRELRYLRDRGYRFEQSGDYWVAVPGR